MDSPPPYVIVTPARDEEEFVERTIDSVLGQTWAPVEWVIVDDGSTDRTAEIVDRRAQESTRLRVVHRDDRGHRAAGSGVMEAFYSGFDAIQTSDWKYLVKLDCDLEFDADYFERCLSALEADPELGIGGGVIYNCIDGRQVLEKHPRFHVRGATKIYRRACWEAIGGLHRVPGWDTLDEVKANQLGWKTQSFDDAKLVQFRFTGDAAGQWSNWVKNGRASYICGYHPLYLMTKAFARITKKPYIVATLGVIWGYFKAFIQREPRVPDTSLIRYLRGQQLRRLLGMRSIWR
ncbi:MAG: glycosyltransferase family 2 protein [Planctomycetes bacterium]|nr:glycosyltransferase family 2 protein [Planctomycetota bacterium]